jgi:hypothetical protein
MLGWRINDYPIDNQLAFTKRTQASNCPQERSLPNSVRAKHANYFTANIK